MRYGEKWCKVMLVVFWLFYWSNFRNINNIIMKNKILILGLAVTMLASVATVSFPAPAQAARLTQNQIEQIIGLLRAFNVEEEAIANVEAILTGASSGGGGSGSSAWCYTFNRDLRIGNSGKAVVALSTALGREGFTAGMEEKGVFGEAMASAVVGFQEKYKSEILTPNNLAHGTGFVGISTRAKLNSLYGCGVTPPVQVPPTLGVVSEQVKCVFNGATTEQKCYAYTEKLNTTFFCSGIGTCVTNVKGFSGAQLTWKSSCGEGEYAYTTIDGNNEYVNFSCSDTTQPSPVQSSPSQPLQIVSVTAGPITNPANGHQYYLLSHADWESAEAKAVSLGGHLVAIDDSAENKFIMDNFGRIGGVARVLWTGLHKDSSGAWTWSTGEPVSFTNWAPGEPNNGAGVYAHEEAMHIWNPDQTQFPLGSWNDSQEFLTYESVAEVGSGTNNTTQPSITYISPSFGPINSSVTVTGSNFTSTGNQVSFSCAVTSSGSGVTNVSSTDGRTLTLTVPSIPVMSGSSVNYPLNCNVSVTNASGTSNSVSFTITAPTVNQPIVTLSANQIATSDAQPRTYNVTWSSTNANSCVLTTNTTKDISEDFDFWSGYVGPIQTSGSITNAEVYGGVTMTITCTGSGGTAAKSVVLNGAQTSTLSPEMISAMTAFSQQNNLNTANVLRAVEQLMRAFR